MKPLHQVKTGIHNKHTRMKIQGEANLNYDNVIQIMIDVEIMGAQDKIIQNQFKSLDISNNANNTSINDHKCGIRQ